MLSPLVAERSVTEAAHELSLTPTTVKTHRRTIYRKLGVTNRQQAIARAAELSLAQTLDPDESSRMNPPCAPSQRRPSRVTWNLRRADAGNGATSVLSGGRR